jgi:HEAT repeat protein
MLPSPNPLFSLILEHQDPFVIGHCLEALGGMLEDPKETFSFLAGLLRHENEVVRIYARSVVYRFPLDRIGSVDQIVEALTIDDDEFRESLQMQLDHWPGDQALATPAVGDVVARLLNHPNEGVRAAAASLVKKLGASAVIVFPAVARALSDPSRPVRSEAIHSLLEIGPIGAPLIPRLVSLLQDKDYSYRNFVISSLFSMGSAAAEAAATLKETLQDPDEEIRFEAALALSVIDPSYQGAIPVLVDRVKDRGDKRSEIREQAAQGLARFGTLAIDSVPALCETFRVEEVEDVRKAVANAIKTIVDDCAAVTIQRTNHAQHHEPDGFHVLPTNSPNK